MKAHFGLVSAAVLLGLSVVPLRADVVLAPLFSDGAVLQREKPVPVWGWADPGEKVVVTFESQRREATAGPDGRWLAVLSPLRTATEGTVLTITGKNVVVVRDVLVGEVWLAAGEGNMDTPLARVADAEVEIARAQAPQLRHVRIERTLADLPADQVKTGGWQAATPETAGAFGAIGYFFARDLHHRLGVPIGIVQVSWPHTPIEAWMSGATLFQQPQFHGVLDRWRKAVEEFPQQKRDYETRLAAWTQAEAAARRAPPVPENAKRKTVFRGEPEARHAEWLRANPRPAPPRGGFGDPSKPSGVFNGMMNPLLPFALRGVLWAQGESDASNPADYRVLFPALISGWRAHFGQGDLPFFWTNLAGARLADAQERERSLAFFREAQTEALALAATGQALTLDLGDRVDLHSVNKQEVARRLAALAKNRVYELVSDDVGPMFLEATREGAAMRVRFAHASGGLVAHERPVQSLELAGADGVFHPAEGRIERDTLVVTSAKVREPVAVRYAFGNAPLANLYNGAGLPAAPFRSDRW